MLQILCLLWEELYCQFPGINSAYYKLIARWNIWHSLKSLFVFSLEDLHKILLLPFLPEGSILLPFFQITTSKRRARTWPQCGLSFLLPAWPVICIFAALTVSLCPPLQATTDSGDVLRIKLCPTLKLELDLPFQNGLSIFTLGVFSHLQRENLISQLLSKITHSLTYVHGKKALMARFFKGF